MDISEWGMGPFGASHEKTIDHGRVMAAIVLKWNPSCQPHCLYSLSLLLLHPSSALHLTRPASICDQIKIRKSSSMIR